MVITFSKVLASTWPIGENDAEHAGIGHEDVELAPALWMAPPSRSMPAMSARVERHQRRLAAGRLDLVVEFFQPADRARNRYDMRAGGGQFPGDEIADAARGAGDDRNAAGKVEGHARMSVRV